MVLNRLCFHSLWRQLCVVGCFLYCRFVLPRMEVSLYHYSYHCVLFFSWRIEWPYPSDPEDLIEPYFNFSLWHYPWWNSRGWGARGLHASGHLVTYMQKKKEENRWKRVVKYRCTSLTLWLDLSPGDLASYLWISRPPPETSRPGNLRPGLSKTERPPYQSPFLARAASWATLRRISQYRARGWPG